MIDLVILLLVRREEYRRQSVPTQGDANGAGLVNFASVVDAASGQNDSDSFTHFRFSQVVFGSSVE